MRRIVKELVSDDKGKKVAIFERADGTFGFEVLVFGDAEQTWLPQRGNSTPFLPDLESAVREARERVEWLRKRPWHPQILLEPDARQIDEIIDRDLREHPDFFNSHHVNLDKCRVTPSRITCANSLNGNAPIQLWIVLREPPETKGGYLVVFDEARGTFGLAVERGLLPVFLGWYGSFTETLTGM